MHLLKNAQLSSADESTKLCVITDLMLKRDIRHGKQKNSSAIILQALYTPLTSHLICIAFTMGSHKLDELPEPPPRGRWCSIGETPLDKKIASAEAWASGVGTYVPNRCAFGTAESHPRSDSDPRCSGCWPHAWHIGPIGCTRFPAVGLRLWVHGNEERKSRE